MDEKFPLALPEGTILAGQYMIEKALGQGGFGITYRAVDHKTGQKVAVKEFFPDTLAYRETTTVISYPGERTENYEYGKESFLQEAQTLAEFIGNENIVRIHSYFEENGTAYFVMDYIEGKSFDEYLKEKGGRIGIEETERILLPIMDALNAVHSKGIVHRDVTPDNIYLTNDGKVKLLDFGAARYSLGDKSRSLDVILKHGFAPKEQYTRRGKQGPFTDVYSLGATFYFALTGKRPPDSVERLDEDDLIPPSSLGVEIPKQKEDAILKALSVQPQDRFQSMGEFKNAMLAGTAARAPQSAGATNRMVFTAPVQPVQPQPQPMPQQQVRPMQQQPMPSQQIRPMQQQPMPQPMPQQVRPMQPQPMPPQQAAAVPKKKNAPAMAAVIGGSIAGGVFLIAVIAVVMVLFLNGRVKEVSGVKYTMASGVTGVYTGSWQHDAPQGEGRMVCTNGDVYEGEWEDGKRSGQGTITYADGSVYEGEWKDGKQNGQGTLNWADGDVYEGEWKDGQYNGQGTYTWADGRVYKGEWKDDKKSGQGTMTYANGNVYEGEWANNEPNGYGTCTWANGDVYEGEWVNDRPSGYGVYTYANGDVYEGEWKDGLRNGQGTFISSNGRQITGTWVDGEWQG